MKLKPHGVSLLGLLLLLPACGEVTPPLPGHRVLVILNRGQRPLLQLMLHSRIDNYRGQPNLLGAPLEPKAQVTLAEPAIQPGSWFVTVIRETVVHEELVAVTTASPIALQDGLQTLWVEDENFYFFPAKRVVPDGPGRDLGSPDRGQGDRRPPDRSGGEARPDGARPEARPPDLARDVGPRDVGTARDVGPRDVMPVDGQGRQ